jgi:predicted DNA-binding protein YlxM (UPF0122 family)
MGWETVAWCEWDRFCQMILRELHPEAYAIADIHDLTVDNYGNLLYLCKKEVITMGQPKSTKYNHAVNLYESGMSIQDCAEFYEISRQAMHKILTRRGCKFRDNLKYGTDNHFYRGSAKDLTKKERCHNIVEKAIKKGSLINPGTCEACGSSGVFKDGRTSIQAHHSDYDQPLKINWLCQKCHHLWHKNNKAINENDTEKTNEPSAAIDIVSGGFP